MHPDNSIISTIPIKVKDLIVGHYYIFSGENLNSIKYIFQLAGFNRAHEPTFYLSFTAVEDEFRRSDDGTICFGSLNHDTFYEVNNFVETQIQY